MAGFELQSLVEILEAMQCIIGERGSDPTER